MTTYYTTTADGGWGSEGIEFDLGVDSGSDRLCLGVSDWNDAAMHGKKQTTSLYLSLTPEEAEGLGKALIAHADAVRDRQKEA